MALSTLLSVDFLSDVQNEGLTTIKADRNKYKPIWKAIERYCGTNKIIISDKYVLTDKQDELVPIYEKNYKIYTSNPFRHANNLVNLIHQTMTNSQDRKFTRLKTIIEKEEFVIEYDMRQVAFIYKLQKHKTTEPNDIIKPIDIKGVLYMPAEIELIDIYHNLYKMQNCEEMEKMEKVLYEQVRKRKEEGIIGGQSCKDLKKEFLEAMKISIVKDWLPKKENTILVGAWAHDWIVYGKDKLCANIEKVQLISEIKPDDMLSQLQLYVGKLASNASISMREQELHIPKDFRTSRYTYYLQIKSAMNIIEKPFLDLFNSADFEIIPYKNINGINLGQQWVLLRFLFIDLWIIRVIKTLGLLSEDILNKKLIYLWRIIEFFRSDMELTEFGEFIGIYRDYSIDKKIQGLSQTKKYYPYYPDVYLKESNHYREI